MAKKRVMKAGKGKVVKAGRGEDAKGGVEGDDDGVWMTPEMAHDIDALNRYLNRRIDVTYGDTSIDDDAEPVVDDKYVIEPPIIPFGNREGRPGVGGGSRRRVARGQEAQPRAKRKYRYSGRMRKHDDLDLASVPFALTDKRRRGRPRTPLRDRIHALVAHPDRYRRMELTQRDGRELLAAVAGKRMRSDPKTEIVTQRGVGIDRPPTGDGGGKGKRATRTVQFVTAGCEECGGSAEQVIWRSVGVAAKHHDRTKHVVWFKIDLQGWYGVKYTTVNRRAR